MPKATTAKKTAPKPNPKPAAKPAPKRRVPTANAAPRDVAVKVDPKLKRLWDQTRAVIEQAKGQGATAFDELWEAVGRAVSHEPPLYVLGGYASPKEFFREELHEEERTARRYMRVAKFATPNEEATYGVAVLDAAIGYLEAKGGRAVDGALPVAFDRLRIPLVGGARDGAAASVPLAEATVAQINAATRALADRAKKKPGPKSALRDALLATLKADKTLAAIAVHEANGFVSFTHVPVAAMARFARALTAARVKFEA
jgi:hypothetical protein